MKLTASILFSVVCFVFTSCEFSPTGTNVHDIPLPVPNIDITVLNANTVNVLRGTVSISYKSILNGHTLRSVQLYLDDTEIGSSTVDSGYISFYSDYHHDGNYTLKLVLITSTNSGSLADNLGAEVFVATRTYPVIVFNAPLHVPSIQQFSVENGAFKISWDQYTQPGFEKYVLKKNFLPYKEFTNANTVSYIDTTFAGEGAFFEITTYIMGREFVSGWEYYSGPHPTLAATYAPPDNKIQLHWNRSPYSVAFGSYQIIRHYPDPSTTTVTKTDINDTTFMDETAPFGGGIKYELRVVSKYGAIGFNRDSIYGGWYGILCPCNPGAHFEYIPATNVYFQYSLATVSLFNGNTLELTQTHALSSYLSGYIWACDMSNNGSYCYSVTNPGNAQINRHNPSTLQVEETVSLSGMALNGSTPFSLVVSENNILAGFFINTNYTMDLIVLDMTSRTLRARRLLQANYATDMEISADGQYIIQATNLFRVANDTIIKVGDIGYGATFAKDNNYIVQGTANRLQLVRCSDLLVVQEVTINGSVSLGSINVDRTTGLVGVEEYPKQLFEVFDMTTGQVRASIQVSAYGLRYQNGLLFSTSGGYIPVPLH